jgi:N-alpha-acetyltransferase 15/16, NatA auxiliary subunit
LPDKAAEVLKSCSSIVPKASEMQQFNEEFKKRHAGSTKHALAALKVRRMLDPSDATKNAAEKETLAALDGSASLGDAQAGLEMLKEWKSGEKVIGEYLAQARKKWPEAAALSE